MISYIILLTIFGAAAIVLVPMPFRLGSHIKKIATSGMVAVLLALGAAVILAPVLFPQPTIPITITATDEKNGASAGSEVVLEAIHVDDKSVNLDKALSDGWIKKDNGYGWKNYDQPEGMSDTLTGQIPVGTEYTFVFEKNKWRGFASVEIDNNITKIDCYADSEDSLKELVNLRLDDQAPVQGNTRHQKLMIAGIVFACSFLAVLTLCYRFEWDKGQKLTDNSNHELWPDILRIFGAFTIIWLHNTCNIYISFTENISVWNKYLYVNSFTAFAVPCFFLLSGAFLLNREHDIKTTLQKRIPRLVIPLVFWSIIYIFVRKFHFTEDIGIIKTILKIPFEGQFSHLGYLYVLIGIYLLLPIISKSYMRLSRNEKTYGMILILFLPAFIYTAFAVFAKSFKIPSYALMFPNLGLFCLGAVLMEHQKALRERWKLAIAGTAFGYYLIVFLSFYSSFSKNSPTKDFFGMDKLPVIIFSVSIFILFLSFEDRFKRLPHKVTVLIRKVSDLTMGIYLTHMMFVELIGPIRLGPVLLAQNQGSLLGMFFVSVLYFMASLALCFVLSKIPFIRRVIK